MTRAPVDDGFYQTPSQQLGQPAAAQSARLRLESPRLNVASLACRFRQLPGKTMELVVFTAVGRKKHDFGTFDQSKYSATKTVADSGTFSVKKLEPEDQGVYFCAVSQHGAAAQRQACSKTVDGYSC